MHKAIIALRAQLGMIAFLSIVLYGLGMSLSAEAAVTSTVYPTSDGNYQQWTPNAGVTRYTQVDETTCNGNTDYISEATVGERNSFGISLSSVPDGATITQISITPCASRNSGGGGGSATLKVFYRFNGSDSADFGSYALTGTTPANLAATNIGSLGLVKTSSSTLEVGAVYSAGTKGARLSRFATVITYTPAAPIVTTDAASGISITGATLNGTGNPNGATTTGWFRYSTTNPGTCSDSFGTRTPTSGGSALGAGSSAVAFNAVLSTLSANTTYYYCAIASNSTGTSTGSVQSFATANYPVPTVTTNVASAVTQTTATLNGAATPNGASTTGWFRYATSSPGTCDDTFGFRAPTSGGDALGSGTSSVAYSEGVTGLSAGVTYYYCAIASNAGGTGVGSVQSFTTLPNIPTAPSGASATNVSGTQNNMTWTDNSSDEDGFKVERSTNGGAYAQIATTSANATSYNDTGATADNTYEYRVRAYNVSGNSAYSTTSYVITATVVPNAPTSFWHYISTSSPSDVQLGWSHSGNNESGFVVEKSTDNINFSTAVTADRNVTYVVDSGVSSGTYYYRVYATNAIGNSSNSNTETVIVP